MITVGALGVAFVATILILAAQRFLLPGIIIIGSFIMLALWLTGLIETALQLYGGQANVNSNCQNYVTNMPWTGNTVETLAWLTQNTICTSSFFFLFLLLLRKNANIYGAGNCWKAAFAFELVNTIFYFWMMVMSWQVHKDAT